MIAETLGGTATEAVVFTKSKKADHPHAHGL